MKLENFKLLFKSKKIVDSIYQQKKLYKVFDNIWLEILQDHKGFYVHCTNKELFAALNDVMTQSECVVLAKMKIVLCANVLDLFLKNLLKQMYINRKIYGTFI